LILWRHSSITKLGVLPLFKSAVVCLIFGFVLIAFLPVNRADAMATFYDEGSAGSYQQFVIVQSILMPGQNVEGPLAVGASTVETSTLSASAMPRGAVSADALSSLYEYMLDETAVITSAVRSFVVQDSLRDMSQANVGIQPDLSFGIAAVDFSGPPVAFTAMDDSGRAGRTMEDVTGLLNSKHKPMISVQ